MSKICGIYLITNIITNKHYVGMSINCYSRFSKHKSLLNKNKHSNPHLQESWNKYGEHNFIFSIIDECEKELMASLENYWCNLLWTHNRELGYNILSTSPHGKVGMAKETIDKIRLANTGKHCSDETKKICKVIS